MDFDLKQATKTVFAVAGAAMLLYQAAAAFYRGAPLRMVVNPYRRQWLVAGFSVMMVAYSGIALSAGNKWDPESIVAELHPELKDGKTEPRVVVAALFLLLGLGLMGSVAYCWWVYPRDPKSFDVGKQPPDAAVKNVVRALHHYVTRPGGLEYAAVIALPPSGSAPMPTVEQLIASHGATGPDAPPYRLLEWISEGELKGIRRRRHLEAGNRRELAADRAVWLTLALAAHPRAREQAVPCLQSDLGDVTLIQTRTRFGGLLLEYLYPSKEGEPDFLLFGVTMNSGETEGNRFYEHFAMLRRAVRYLLPDKYSLGPTVFPTELAVSAAPPPTPPSPPTVPAGVLPPDGAEATGLPVAGLPVAGAAVSDAEGGDNPDDEPASLAEPPVSSDPVP